MLFLGLISFLVAIPLFSSSITSSLFTRITSLLLFFSALLAFHGLYMESVASGVGIYSGLFHITQLSLGMETFLLIIGGILLLSWAPVTNNTSFLASMGSSNTTKIPTINEYGLLIVFTTIGSCFLLTSSDLVSMYLSIELQSFAVYILATLYRSSESATSAGLKYFLLGGLSSALILLGTAFVYSSTGLTQFESIYSLCQTTGSVPSDSLMAADTMGPLGVSTQVLESVLLGLVLIGVGLLFKVASAPFHNWAPDVYDGVPTIVTSWLTTMPKISIFLFLLELQSGLGGSFSIVSLLQDNDALSLGPFGGEADGSASLASLGNVWKNLLLVASLLSLVIGTVLGLSQYRIKRLLAYSTISHVGFLLLALAINTEDSVESFLFYLIQYSITNVATFFILLAFGYSMYTSATSRTLLTNVGSASHFINNKVAGESSDISFTKELTGQFKSNPLLSLSLALCLFSMAGIPPLVGFFAKQMVLYSSMHAGYNFLSVVAILVSVISASYYLKIVRILYFDSSSPSKVETAILKDNSTILDAEANTSLTPEGNGITNIHSLLIASLTMLITFFILHPSPLLNSCYLLALSLFYY